LRYRIAEDLDAMRGIAEMEARFAHPRYGANV